MNFKLADPISALWPRLRGAPLQAQVWFDLASGYATEGLSWQAAYCARQALRCDEKLKERLRALALDGGQDSERSDALLGRAVLPDAGERARKFAAQVRANPGDWLSWLYLARLRELAPVADGAGNAPSADHALSQAKALEPIAGESLHWMGVWRLNSGDAQGSVQALSGLLDIRPVRTGSMMYLGEALLRLGNGVAAEKAFARAALSSNPDFLQTLAAKVFAYNYWQEAIAILRRATGLRPDSLALWLALAKVQSETYELADCRVSLQRAFAIDADSAEARMLTAGLQGRMGDAKGHLATLEAEYAASGDPLARTASSIAMTMLYNEELSAEAVAQRHRDLCAPIEAATTRATTFTNQRNPSKRLRVGYVSGDFHRQHPVNIFMLPVLLRHNHARVEVFVYHTGTMHDEYTRQAKGCADKWLEAAGMDDSALQKAIVSDGVDVLVDLAGHTSTHRLGVFAMRAAPVQATFLGYPHSTGLSSMDWMIGDRTVSPAEHGHLFSEGIAQLPDCVWTWAPVDNYPLPTMTRGAQAPVVFGSFNNAMKLTPATIALWAKVLHGVSGSQLLLKAPSLRDTAVQERFAQAFSDQGIARSRLVMRGPTGLADMMQEYADIDIALDPLPYNGGTTSLQALWMGVPVVCLEGRNFVGRMGASFMRTLHQPEWVAQDEAGYLAAARALAGRVGDLRTGRAALRAQMSASPLCDINTYVRNFEALLRCMWERHCGGDQSRVIEGDAVRQAAVAALPA